VPEPRLRVLLAFGASNGGIGRHVASLAAGLAGRDIAVTVCAPAAAIAAFTFADLPVQLAPAPLGEGAPAALLRSRRVLRAARARVDVVHAHGLRVGAQCTSLRSDLPLAVTWHNAALGGTAQRLAHSAMARYTARGAAVTFAASEDLGVAARAAGARDVRDVFVAAPPLRPPRRDRATVRADLGVGARPLVLAIGRLHAQKRLDVLVSAAAAWSSTTSAPLVVIAGDGPARDGLEAQISATGAPVRLLGARDDVAELLSAADVVALPSAWEARSLAAQEALRAGVPLVTTPVGGLPALVGAAAVMVPVGDADALRAAIESVLSDPQRQRTLIAAGRERAAFWPDLDQMVDEAVMAYLDLRSRSRR
jgi:glycosyltransferase involved in cell wall biosynthesis